MCTLHVNFHYGIWIQVDGLCGQHEISESCVKVLDKFLEVLTAWLHSAKLRVSNSKGIH